MRYLLQILSRIELGFWLLISASILLFAGAIVADSHSVEFIKLNSMLFPAWLAESYNHPELYMWIVILFIILFVLAANTFTCTLPYIRSMFSTKMSFKKIGIIMFHLSFLFFLAGHFLYEFTGMNETLFVEKGVNTRVENTDLTIKPLSIETKPVTIRGKSISMKTTCSLYVKSDAGSASQIYLEMMQPKSAEGYSFHIPVAYRNQSDAVVKIIVRKDYGLYVLAFGSIVSVLAALFFTLGIIQCSKHQLPRR